MLTHDLLPAFGDRPITAIDGASARGLDVRLGTRKGRRNRPRTRGTRNNVQTVLRSTLQFAVREGYIPAVPSRLPVLKQSGRTVLEIPSDDDVAKILAVAAPSRRRVFLLMAYAGLRPNEVRALAWRDVQLGATGGFLTVRHGKSYGELHTPKTGQREIPLAPPLWKELVADSRRAPDRHVAMICAGKPWGQHGIAQAFNRVMEGAGLSGSSVYALRHYAIRHWLRAGIRVHVVQRMAGHTNLSTTRGTCTTSKRISRGGRTSDW